MPTEKNKQQVSVTIDGDLARWLDGEAEARMVGKGYLVERALRALRSTLMPLDSGDEDTKPGKTESGG